MLQEKKNRNAMEKKRRSEQQRYVKWKRNNSEEGEKESETEGEVEGWEVDRQITTRLRLADSCESRIWYCSTNTQTRTYAGVDTHTHVCTYTHAHHHGLKGAHTHAHTIQKSHITHEILMVQSNRQKWRWVDRRKTQGEDSGGGKKERWMKAICLYCQCWCDIWTTSKRIYMESSLLAWACSTCTNYLFPSLVFYLFHRDTKEGHPEC